MALDPAQRVVGLGCRPGACDQERVVVEGAGADAVEAVGTEAALLGGAAVIARSYARIHASDF